MELDSRIAKKSERFAVENSFDTIGPLAMSLVITDRAIKDGLPLNPDNLLTPQEASVSGLSGQAANRIFARFGIDAFFGTESGRTSRGMPAKMKAFVEFLNKIVQTVENNPSLKVQID